MSPVTERGDVGESASPPDRSLGQGVEQDPAQVAPQHFGPAAVAIVQLLEQHRAVVVEQACSLAARADDRAEGVGQARRGERGLTVLGVNVELTALGTRVGRRLGLVDDRADAVEVEHAGEDQPA